MNKTWINSVENFNEFFRNLCVKLKTYSKLKVLRNIFVRLLNKWRTASRVTNIQVVLSLPTLL
jgi:hypothetical protein